MLEYKVYSIDGLKNIDLTEHFQGSYSKCKTWVNNRAKAGYSANFYLISSQPREKLLRKYR